MNLNQLPIALLAGFDEGPFYYHVKKGEGTNWTITQAAEHLQLKPSLVEALTAWDEDYQGILDMNDPRESGFPSPEAERAWIETGRELAARLKQESPVVASVDYQADGSIPHGTCVF
ncbi:hypothetical protein [Actinoalloteichus sp. GBA129-24]|uniref:hypothetical protein n=1 Tax=Actinoalloteichus sp. GBA129-24 TaxID=1612551 RepID=UPI00095040B0|nr:hypothetical protein [Actinoalloteichus sp. GBA129-24]APU19329.1 hypothetical protein UA75_06530 [Actinoalloteichus sp. GBA129-24]